MAGKSLTLSQQRILLERRIERERDQMRSAVDEWMQATAPIDQATAKLARFKKPIMLVGGIVMARYMRKSPRKLVRVARKGLGLYALFRNVRKLV